MLTKEQQLSLFKLLEKQISFSLIKKECKKLGFSVSKSTLSRYKNNGIPVHREYKKKIGVGRKCTLTNKEIGKLKRMVNKENAPTLKTMACKLNTSINVVRYALRTKVDVKLVKKPKGHFMSEDCIKKRYHRSWLMYNLLKCNKWKNVITVDEAWFYLSNADGQRSVQYISRTKKRRDAARFVKPTHPKGVMVFLGMSYNGLTKPIFVENGAKINSAYYIKKCLQPLLANANILYPDENWMLHQDSAPSHTSSKTQEFLNAQHVCFIQPHQWSPNSPDLAPCDYFLWGHLKHQMNSSQVKNIKQLKNLIRHEVEKIPLQMVQKALKSWPKRCRQVYYAKGKHIQK